MFRVWTVFKKEISQLRRNRLLVRIIVIAPIIQLFILGYAATFEVKNMPIAIYDEDKSSFVREIVDALNSTETFKVALHLENLNQIDYVLKRGTANIVVIFRHGFERKIMRGEKVELPIIIDGTNANSATIAMGFMSSIVMDKFIAVIESKLSNVGIKFVPMCQPEIRIWFNPEMRSTAFIIPGLIGMILITVTLVVTSMTMVREKEQGTVELLLVTPIKPYELLLGKILPFILIGLFDAIAIILIGKFWFGVPLRGSVFLLFISVFVFLLTTLGLGIFSSVISRTQQQALMTAYFFAMPNIVLSGFVFPVESMPYVIRFITNFMPLKYFLIILRGIFLKGAGLEVLYPQILILLGFGIIIFGFSVFRFRKYLG
ncbi:ABC transporter permease [Candidatus Kryptonium thompsonii]|jgi:ABC-2 type transport system permease protein|uniref:ABC-2 type transport system permease protein n=1 Tax=Candidatus Kryptonium thompsonii TaxID=1633631 RepID=A0ABP2AUJ0_9BACT|nr:ABC transporter permease [Candidatus Kryptonium thompsoni]CUS83066.1 ABC-2 type transport system permease protein [Candidatus Kryptonium thompsoni]CUT03427.1 ABC-2 type transport system permease protein [Candidatus Kryptonium thompsoni]